MKKDIYSIFQWVVIGFVICIALTFIEAHSSIVLLLLATLTNYCDFSFLILQNIIVEGLIFLALQRKKLAELPNKYSLSIANIIVWICFTVWYCQGNYYADGIASLPYSQAMMWMGTISEKIASFSQYIVWVTILLTVEGIISFIIDRYIKIGKIVGRVIVGVSLVLAGYIIFNGKNVESYFVNGPKYAYSVDYDMYIKAWQTSRNILHVEIYREQHKDTTHLVYNDVVDYAGPIFLRQDSIALLPWSKEEPFGEKITILQKGSNVIYEGYDELRSHKVSAKMHATIYIDINPVNITIYPRDNYKKSIHLLEAD